MTDQQPAVSQSVGAGTPDPVLTIVLPAYNEASNIGPMAARIKAVLKDCPHAYEVIWVNDGSTDATATELDALAASDPQTCVLHLSRNFGHMAALTAGLDAACGTGAVITLDADGQHPPELIPTLLAEWEKGADIVQMIRRKTASAGIVKEATSRMFYSVMNRLSAVAIPPGAADFRLLDRQVVDTINGLPERVRFLRGLTYWVGFNYTEIPYDAPDRLSGTTKYSFRQMVRFALNGIASFSVRPLRMAFLLGLIVLFLAGIYAIYVLVCVATGVHLERGWASLLLVSLCLGGVQLLTLGIASEYLARIYDEAKKRPIYIVRKPRGQTRP
ncbi:MAG: glycosyltransferase family 2 protein [Candidatus Sumerlaeaceae bacterium]|nr:glycosyltransferase family 2 protein [Candidatus Sumerlaeaceae bacterium]